MAATDYPVNHPLAIKHWSRDLMKEALKRTHALQFMGTGSDTICTIKTELNKDAGDQVRIGIRLQLNGAGIAGDDTLEGNEEALETRHMDVTINQLRHAVRSNGKMSEQRVPFSVRREARDGLADWWADRYDTWFFNQLAGASHVTDVRYTGMQPAVSPDADHHIFAGHNSEASISTTNVFTLELIDYAVEIAKTAKHVIRPVRVGGKEYLVGFLHPYQVTDLRRNTNPGQWMDIQKAAMAGGDVRNNPIFTGALGVYNNVILHESTRLPTAPGRDNVRRAVICGAQALVMGYGRGHGKNTYSWKEELFDYGNQLGVAAGCICGMVKTRFDGSDYGTVVISTYAVKHTSAS